MKKIISIAFLIIFLFNVGGYYLVFWALRSQAKEELLHRLDADEYTSEDIEVLTIPLTLPYTDFQDVGYKQTDGEFEHNGSYFNIVKQKVENDTLFLVVVKNLQEKKLVSAMNEYSSLMNNVPASTKKTIELFGKLFKDYSSLSSPRLSYHSGWCRDFPFGELDITPLTKDYPILAPPPKVS